DADCRLSGTGRRPTRPRAPSAARRAVPGGVSIGELRWKHPKALLVVQPLELTDDDDIRVKTTQTRKLGLHTVQAAFEPCSIGHGCSNVDFASVVGVACLHAPIGRP